MSKAVLRVTDMGGTVNYDYELNVEDAHSPISSVFVLTITRMSALTDSGSVCQASMMAVFDLPRFANLATIRDLPAHQNPAIQGGS